MNTVTLIIFLIVIAAVVADIVKITWDRQHGVRSCGYNCEGCMGHSGSCNSIKKSRKAKRRAAL